jgi:hypothetical protein
MAGSREQATRGRNYPIGEPIDDLVRAYQNLLTSRAAVIKELTDNNACPSRLKRLRAQQGRDKATLKKITNER